MEGQEGQARHGGMHLGFILLGSYWGSIGIIKNKMETTIVRVMKLTSYPGSITFPPTHAAFDSEDMFEAVVGCPRSAFVMITTWL